jgi:hypothetical protein
MIAISHGQEIPIDAWLCSLDPTQKKMSGPVWADAKAAGNRHLSAKGRGREKK